MTGATSKCICGVQPPENDLSTIFVCYFLHVRSSVDLGDRHVQDCDIVLAFPPDTPEATVVWLRERIHRLQVRSVLSGQNAVFQ